jgi:hypothetical protein
MRTLLPHVMGGLQVTVFAPSNDALDVLASAHPDLARDLAANASLAEAFVAYHGKSHEFNFTASNREARLVVMRGP